jgi:hypothetical protein
LPPGANGAAGHEITDNVPLPEKLVSVTFTLLKVTLPEFDTRNEYVTVEPAFVTVVGDAVFTTVNAGAGAAVTVAVEG